MGLEALYLIHDDDVICAQFQGLFAKTNVFIAKTKVFILNTVGMDDLVRVSYVVE